MTHEGSLFSFAKRKRSGKEWSTRWRCQQGSNSTGYYIGLIYAKSNRSTPAAKIILRTPYCIVNVKSRSAIYHLNVQSTLYLLGPYIEPRNAFLDQSILHRMIFYSRSQVNEVSWKWIWGRKKKPPNWYTSDILFKSDSLIDSAVDFNPNEDQPQSINIVAPWFIIGEQNLRTVHRKPVDTDRPEERGVLSRSCD